MEAAEGKGAVGLDVDITKFNFFVCEDCAWKRGAVQDPDAVNCGTFGRCPMCGREAFLLPPSDYCMKVQEAVASQDRKTRMYPNQANAFGILPGPPDHGGTCPWATRGAGGCFCVPEGKKAPTCYACNIMNIYAGSRKRVSANTEALRLARTPDRIADVLEPMLADFERKTTRYARQKGLDPVDLMRFRWHWSGDIVSDNHAKGLSIAMSRHPDITFWTYTRSFNRAKWLDGVDNLILYFSFDDDNWEKGLAEWFHQGMDQKPNRRIAYMAKDTWSLARMLASACKDPSKYGPRDRVYTWARAQAFTQCPVDLGKMPTEDACSRCRMCNSKDQCKLLFFKC